MPAYAPSLWSAWSRSARNVPAAVPLGSPSGMIPARRERSAPGTFPTGTKTGTMTPAVRRLYRLPSTHTKQTKMLKGTELLDAIRSMETASRTEQCLSCGYVRENGKPAFTSFFEAILEARGITTEAQEKEELLTEYKDSEELETLQELLEDYSADAIKAFVEYFGTGMLESFTDSYQGEMSGAEFAQQYTEDCWCVDIPGFVEVDWEATWQNLERYDYAEQDGFIFCCNF